MPTSVVDSKDPGMGAREGREEGGKNPPVLEYTSRKDFFFTKLSRCQSVSQRNDKEIVTNRSTRGAEVKLFRTI